MGWLFSNDPHFSKADLVAEFRSPGYLGDGAELVADRVVGNHYWSAVKYQGRVSIGLFLMQPGGPNEGYGYKFIHESSGPGYYDCPLALLDLATEADPQSRAPQWRQDVRDHHAARAARPKPVHGLVVTYGGATYRLESSAGRWRGWNVTRCRDGQAMYMKARQLSVALDALTA